MSSRLHQLCEQSTPQELDAAVKATFFEIEQRIAAHPKGFETLNQATDAYLAAPVLGRA